MSQYDYQQSKIICAQEPTFYALIMAAMRQADTDNLERLQGCWPGVWDELDDRYNAPGGRLPGDPA